MSRLLLKFISVGITGWASHCLGDNSHYSFRCLIAMPVGKAGIASCCAAPSMPEQLADQEDALAGHDSLASGGAAKVI